MLRLYGNLNTNHWHLTWACIHWEAPGHRDGSWALLWVGLECVCLSEGPGTTGKGTIKGRKPQRPNHQDQLHTNWLWLAEPLPIDSKILKREGDKYFQNSYHTCIPTMRNAPHKTSLLSWQQPDEGQRCHPCSGQERTCTQGDQLISPNPLKPQTQRSREGIRTRYFWFENAYLSQNWLLLTRNATSHYLFPQRLAHSHRLPWWEQLREEDKSTASWSKHEKIGQRRKRENDLESWALTTV